MQTDFRKHSENGKLNNASYEQKAEAQEVKAAGQQPKTEVRRPQYPKTKYDTLRHGYIEGRRDS